MRIEQRSGFAPCVFVDMGLDRCEALDHPADEVLGEIRGDVRRRLGLEKLFGRLVLQPFGVFGRAGKGEKAAVLGQKLGLTAVPDRNDMVAIAANCLLYTSDAADE